MANRRRAPQGQQQPLPLPTMEAAIDLSAFASEIIEAVAELLLSVALATPGLSDSDEEAGDDDEVVG
jgi:hypothetical protein